MKKTLTGLLIITFSFGSFGQKSETWLYPKNSDGSIDVSKAIQKGAALSDFRVVNSEDGPKFYPRVSPVPESYTAPNFFSASTDSDLNWEDQFPFGNSIDKAEVTVIESSGTKVYVGGEFRLAGGQDAEYLAEYEFAGGTWTAIPGLNWIPQAIEIDGTDVYVGGDFSDAGGTGSSHIAKWNGSSWTGFGQGLNSTVNAIEVVGSRIFAGGWFTADAGGSNTLNYIAEWNGSSWVSVGGNGLTDVVEDIKMSNFSNRLYIAGRFTNAGPGLNINYITFIDITGGSFTALGAGVNFDVNALHFDTGQLGLLYVGGGFSSAGGLGSTANLARWDDIGFFWSSMPGVLNPGGLNNAVVDITQDGDNLFIAGFFTQTEFGGIDSHRIVRFDKSFNDYVNVNPGGAQIPDGNIQAVASLTFGVNTTAIVGGTFVSLNGSNGAGRIAAYNVTGNWGTLGSGVQKGFPSIAAVARVGNEVFVGGHFTEVAGIPAARLASWNINTGTWTAYNLNNTVNTLATDGTLLYVGGWFTNAGGLGSADYIATYDPGTANWGSLSSGVSSGVEAIEIVGTDIYVGGYFTQAGLVPLNHLGKFSGGIWENIGGPTTGFSYFVKSLAYDQINNTLFVGGFFSEINSGTLSNNLAAYDIGNLSWLAFSNGVSEAPISLKVLNGTLYVGGWFSNAGGLNYPYLASFNQTDGWMQPLPNINNGVMSIAALGDELVLGGWFFQDVPNNIADYYLMKFDPVAGTTYPFGNGPHSGVDDIFVDQEDNIFITGNFEFVANDIESNKLGIWYTPFIQTGPLTLPVSLCAGSSLDVPFTVSGSFDANNIFTAQISDQFGDFANAIDIGSLSGTTDGTISTSIPDFLPLATGYRIRVVSSNPNVTSTVADNGGDLTLSCTIRNYYWVGGSGNWSDFANHWATTSGGSTFRTETPTSLDNVIFDENSFTADSEEITLDIGTGFAYNFDWSGVQFNVTLQSYNNLEIYGNLVLNALVDYQPYLILSSSSTQSITSNGAQLGNSIYIFSGNYFLMDPLTVYYMQISDGGLDLNDQSLTVDVIDIYGSSSLFLTSSQVNVAQSWGMYTNLATFDAGTSMIVMGGYNFNGGNQTYNNLLVSNSGNELYLYGSNAISSLAMDPGAAVRFDAAQIQTLGSFSAAGNSTDLIFIGSTSDGITSTINVATAISGDWLIIQDNTAIGGGPFNANNSINLGNNTGWIFTAPVANNYFWFGGSGNWSDTNHWATLSGGPTLHSVPPTRFDNVYFDGNSFPSGGTVTLDLPVNTCANMVWTGVTNNPSIVSPSSAEFHLYGDITFSSEVTKDLRYVKLGGYDAISGYIIETGGTTFGNNSTIDFQGTGTYFLNNDLLAGTIRFNNGILYTGSHDITANSFIIFGGNFIDLADSRVEVRFFQNFAFLTLSGNFETIAIDGSQFGGQFYGGNQYYNKLELTGMVSVDGDNSYGEFVVNPGSTITLQSFALQSADQFILTGTRPLPIIIKSDSPGDQAFLGQSSGTVTADYVVLKDNDASGGAAFIATNAIDNGNNLGWTFNSFLTSLSYFWVGGSGDWSDSNHWATSTGGSVFHNSGPGLLDNVYFDQNSFDAPGQTVTIDQIAYCYDMNWANLPSANNPQLLNNGYPINIVGSLYLSENMNIGAMDFYFVATQLNKEIIINNADVSTLSFIFDGSGSWDIYDSFTLSSIDFNSGNLTFHDINLDVTSFFIGSSDPKALNLNSSSISTWFWQNFSGNLAFNAGNSDIKISRPGSFFGTFRGGFNAEQYYSVTLDRNSSLNGDNYITNLYFIPNSNIRIQAFTTQNVNFISANGNEDQIISIFSSLEGDQANFSAPPTSSFTVDYVHLMDNNATGGGFFNATNSSDKGNVTGWNGLLQWQEITFDPLNDNAFGNSVALNGSSTSGNAITYSVFSGAGSVTGSNLNLDSQGLVGIKASQSGNSTYGPAKTVFQYIYAYNSPYELGTFKQANFVLGQPDFFTQDLVNSSSVFPGVSSAVVSSNKQLAIAQTGRGRVVLYNNSVPSSSGTPGDVILGKPDFTSTNSTTTDRDMNFSRWVAFSPDGSKLVVSDGNRILIWNSIPEVNYTPADVVVGQSGFSTNDPGLSDTQFNGVWGIDISSDGKLFVVDANNNRVLIFNSIPTENNAAADVVIGADDFFTDSGGTSSTQLLFPIDVAVSEQGQLFISDFQNDRVLVYNSVPTTNGAAADLVLGQPDFNTAQQLDPSIDNFNGPLGVSTFRDQYLAISDFNNHRVMIYDLENLTPANIILGQPDLFLNEPFNGGISGRSIINPYQVHFDPAGNLLVSGASMHRVMFFGAPDINPPTIQNQTSNTYSLMSGESISANVTDDRANLTVYAEISGISQSTSSTIDLVDNGSTFSAPISFLDNSSEAFGIEYTLFASDGYNTTSDGPYYIYLESNQNDRLSTISSTNLPEGTQESNYRIISIPLILDNPALTAVFGDELGNYDPKNWRMFSWNPSGAGSYSELNDGSQLQIGTGYFLLIRSRPSGTVNFGNGSVPQVNRSSPFTKSLSTGWNLIGNPYPFNIAWADILTTSGLASLDGKIYTSNGFQNITTLAAYSGAFVMAPAATTLVFPISSGGEMPNPGNEGQRVQDQNDWQVQFSLRSGEFHNDYSGIGMHEEADFSGDYFDGYTPPRFTAYLEMNSNHPESKYKIAKDIVPVENNHVWTYNLETNVPDDKVKLSWDLGGFDPGEKQLIMMDISNNKIIDMTSRSEFEYPYVDNKQIKIFYGTGDFIAEQLSPEKPYLSNYPNPFIGQTTISFGLPGSENDQFRVRFEVFDITGQMVTSIAEGVYMSGYHELTLNKAQLNIQLKSGIYLLKMLVSGNSANYSSSLRLMIK